MTEQVAEEVLSLPIYPELDEKRFQNIVTALLSFYDGPWWDIVIIPTH